MSAPGRDAARFFDAISGRYERVYALPASASRARMERVVASLPTPPARVLVLGVGTGRELSALLDAGYVPTGFDVSRAMLERCARRSRPVPLVEGDFWTVPLPFGGGAFEGAVALHGTLAHPPGPEALGTLARELARVITPAGRLVFEAPSPAWLDRLPPSPAGVEDESGRRVRRIGATTLVYEDTVVGVGIEATILDEAGWRAALAPSWKARVEPLDGAEWFVVANKA